MKDSLIELFNRRQPTMKKAFLRALVLLAAAYAWAFLA